MIVYGAVLSQFNVLLTGTEFTFTGAVTSRIVAQVDQPTFPIYGATLRHITAPTKLVRYGAVLQARVAPNRLNITGAVSNTLTLGANISGLSISQIAQALHFNVPSYKYNIYPYLVSDVHSVLGLTNYQIIGTDLICTVLPTGPITVIPFNRLQIKAGEIRKLVVTNTIPERAEFRSIQVSGNFLFSLDKITWQNPLPVVDTFYIKAPEMLTDGFDYTKEITITAIVYPRG